MKELRRLAITVPAVVLAALLLVLYLTRGTMEQLGFLHDGSGSENGLVDQRPYLTAQTLAGMAVSTEEQGLAQEAERLADHEVDQAFAMALRQASTQHATLSPAAAGLAAKVEGLKQTVKDDQALVAGLTARAPAGAAPAVGDDLDVAKAQLQLDSDELADATADLARESGDQRGRIHAELAAREAALKKEEDAASGKKSSAVTAVRQQATLWQRGTVWFEQRTRANLIAQAQGSARDEAKRLAAQHDELEHKSDTARNDVQSTAGAGKVKMLETMASRRSIMSILDDREQTELQLAAAYARWEAQVWVQHRILGYLVLESLAWVAFLVLGTMAAGAIGRRLVSRVAPDQRQAHTLRTILTLGLRVLGFIGVLLVVFGVPERITTVLGLATAGLTVVFQDFILAFFGWFVLMGKNGIRVSDWVEINGVGGEVTEIGLFRTMLLEAGNWTSSGHPTGRKVTFTNSFAIRGQYFNFSTHGQWMWDEIRLNVPADANAYELIGKMQEAVEKETAPDAEQAELEWKKVSTTVGLSQFTAKPTVDLRPAASGVDVVVRFVTRASDRFGLRNRIYEALVGLKQGTERPGLAPGAVDKSGG